MSDACPRHPPVYNQLSLIAFQAHCISLRPPSFLIVLQNNYVTLNFHDAKIRILISFTSVLILIFISFIFGMRFPDRFFYLCHCPKQTCIVSPLCRVTRSQSGSGWFRWAHGIRNWPFLLYGTERLYQRNNLADSRICE